MYDLDFYFTFCVNELKAISIPIEPAYIKINNRLQNKWGTCYFDVYANKFSIEINSVLVDEKNPISALKNTIIHELLHTIPGCMNHGPLWKRFAERVNSYYNYNIKATSSAAEKGITKLAEAKVYKLKCLRCGTDIIKYRMCKVVKNPEQFVCSACGGSIIPVNF